jgi:hypothetical protein
MRRAQLGAMVAARRHRFQSQAARACGILRSMDAGSWSAPRSGARDVRASDAEREAVVERLRAHFAEGRLDHDELEERVEAAYRAKMRSELDGLLRDLPAPPSEPTPSTTSAPRQPPPSPYRPLVGYALRWAAVDLGAVGLWAMSGVHQAFWPEWLLLLSGILVARRAGRRLEGRERSGRCRHRFGNDPGFGRGSSIGAPDEQRGPRHLI